MVLRSLREVDRLRPETEEMLLSWQHSGFHVHAGEPVLPDDKARQEHLARPRRAPTAKVEALPCRARLDAEWARCVWRRDEAAAGRGSPSGVCWSRGFSMPGTQNRRGVLEKTPRL